MNHPLHRRKAYAAALEVGIAVKPLKWYEELLGVRHVESDSVVPNKKSGSFRGLKPAELDPGLRLVPGEFPGIAEQVFKRHA
jgi:hypothetical protein